MQILERYLSMTLIKSMLLVLLVFIGLEIFILLATQLDTLGKGSYNIWQAIIYVVLILPQQTYLLFPMAGLLGMLFGLSLLANHSELIIMRAAGISPAQIMRKALTAGVILIALMTFIGEFIAPAAKHLAEKRKLIATSSGQVLKIRQGLWLRQGDNFFYIKAIYSAHNIADISRYEFNNRWQLLSASYAERGHYQHGVWQMTKIQQSEISDNGVSTVFIPKTNWNLAVDPHLLSISLSQPDEMSLSQLADFINYQKLSHLSASNYQIAFWQRIFAPLASLIMMFLATPFIFGPLRSMKTSLRLVLGVLTGFVFYLCNQLFPPLSQVLDFPPVLAALLPLFIFSIIGAGLFRKIC